MVERWGHIRDKKVTRMLYPFSILISDSLLLPFSFKPSASFPFRLLSFLTSLCLGFIPRKYPLTSVKTSCSLSGYQDFQGFALLGLFPDFRN